MNGLQSFLVRLDDAFHVTIRTVTWLNQLDCVTTTPSAIERTAACECDCVVLVFRTHTSVSMRFRTTNLGLCRDVCSNRKSCC